MKPERIEDLLRQPPPSEPSFARPVPALPSVVGPRRLVVGRSVTATSGAGVALVALVIVGLVGLRLGQATPAPTDSTASAPASMQTTPVPILVAGVIPWIDTRFVLPSIAPTEPPTDYALCPSDQLVLLASGFGGATGSATGGLTLINHWANPCRIEPPTLVVLRDATGTEIARSHAQPDATTTALPSGATASATLVWSNWCHPPPALPIHVELTMTLDSGSGPAPATLKDTVSSDGTGSFAPRCDTASSPSTVGRVAFTWDRPQLGDYERQSCSPTDLLAFDNGWGAAAGSSYSDVVIYNSTPFDCELPAEPIVEIRDPDGKLLVSGEGPTGPGPGLPAHGTFVVQLALSDQCAVPQQRPLSLDLRLGSQVLPIELSRGAQGGIPFYICAGEPRSLPSFDVGPFDVPGFDVPEAPTDPGDGLNGTIDVSASLAASVRPGEVLVYTITLVNHNQYGKPINLAAFCPSYEESLFAAGSAAAIAQRYLLNCAPVGVFNAGQSATFEMRLAVPADAPVGEATLIWQLGQRGPSGPKSSIWIGDPSSATTPPPAPTAPTAATAECSAGQLRATGARQGENGVVNIEVDLTNVGPSACWLPNVPTGVALLRSDGKPLPLDVHPAVAEPGPNVLLPVSTTPSASVIAYWANWCASSPGPLTVVVTFDASSGSVSVPLPGSLLGRCDDSARASWIQVDSLFGS